MAAAALIAHAAIFLPYHPNQDGYLGHDYGYFLLQLLAGAFWLQNNGLFAVPWFTPAFCSGIPFYPNPQSLYYSLPQFLTFAVGPVQALQVTFVVRCRRVSRIPPLVAQVLCDVALGGIDGRRAVSLQWLLRLSLPDRSPDFPCLYAGAAGRGKHPRRITGRR